MIKIKHIAAFQPKNLSMTKEKPLIYRGLDSSGTRIVQAGMFVGFVLGMVAMISCRYFGVILGAIPGAIIGLVSSGIGGFIGRAVAFGLSMEEKANAE